MSIAGEPASQVNQASRPEGRANGNVTVSYGSTTRAIQTGDALMGPGQSISSALSNFFHS
ncbi:MAG: hypothetical protein ACJAXR_001705 [Halopseudomonas sp.]|jgi:hypothetical protein